MYLMPLNHPLGKNDKIHILNTLAQGLKKVKESGHTVFLNRSVKSLVDEVGFGQSPEEKARGWQ